MSSRFGRECHVVGGCGVGRISNMDVKGVAMVNLFEALRKGKTLKNVEGWKNVQATSLTLGIVLSALCYILPFFGVEVNISAETKQALVEWIALGLFILNLYWTAATTKKIGISPKAEKI